MGVTIHFEGKLISEQDYDAVMQKAAAFAERVNSVTIPCNASKKVLHRVKNEQDWNYEGPVKGLRLQPHENSDPLILEFDRDLYLQEYCKTQFAGIATHIELISFLKELKPHFEDLQVMDEGEFWETSDAEKLEQHFEAFFEAFEQAKAENPKLKGPFRIEDRIIDLME